MVHENKGAYCCPDRKLAWEQYRDCKPTLEGLLKELYLELRGQLENHGIAPTIKYRVKGFDSYFNKLSDYCREQTENTPQISDLLGMRIVCPFLEDLDQIEQLILKYFDVVELEHKGESLSFREFGYDSVHLLIRLGESFSDLPYAAPYCEIQLRTILQDAWAEVEHELVYKSDLGFPKDTIKRKLASLNASLALSDLIFQEIRDYQKDLRRRGIKRRQSVEELLSACHSTEGGSCGEIKFTVAKEVLSELDQEHSPRGLEKMMYRALEAHSNKDFSLASQVYGRILQLELDSVIRSLIYNHRGMALFAMADYQKAIDDFDMAVQFNEENVRAWCNRGLAYRILGRLDLSLENYQSAIRFDASSLDAYWGRAQTCFEMQMYGRALSDCEQILSLQADFAPAQDLLKAIRRQLF